MAGREGFGIGDIENRRSRLFRSASTSASVLTIWPRAAFTGVRPASSKQSLRLRSGHASPPSTARSRRQYRPRVRACADQRRQRLQDASARCERGEDFGSKWPQPSFDCGADRSVADDENLLPCKVIGRNSYCPTCAPPTSRNPFGTEAWPFHSCCNCMSR